jgi:hypothetical protein
MKLPIFVLLIPLTGCYSIVTVNLGSVNHAASTTGPPMSADVQCAALAQRAIQAGAISLDAESVCQNITQKEAKKKAKQ